MVLFNLYVDARKSLPTSEVVRNFRKIKGILAFPLNYFICDHKIFLKPILDFHLFHWSVNMYSYSYFFAISLGTVRIYEVGSTTF